jgi:protein-S-isoprenylcysteine O-methyltransferase Ste14
LNGAIPDSLKTRHRADGITNSRKAALVVVGVILLLMGIVFALQGANYIGGSALMSGNSTYIYVGAVVAIIGLVLLGLGFRSTSAPKAAVTAESK